MHLRTLLVTALCIGLNSSFCTGGIFSVGAAVTNHMAYADEVSEPMSYGSIGYLSCKTNERGSDEVGSLDLGGCKNASTCFTQANSIVEDRIIPLLVSLVDRLPTERTSYANEHIGQEHYILARAGPLYEESISQTHSLLKRE
jgi:hypothetical protein